MKKLLGKELKGNKYIVAIPFIMALWSIGIVIASIVDIKEGRPPTWSDWNNWIFVFALGGGMLAIIVWHWVSIAILSVITVIITWIYQIFRFFYLFIKNKYINKRPY